MRAGSRRLWSMAGLALWAVTGCRLESSKQQDSQQFRLATPVGALQVKTDAAAAQSGVGLPVYGGATLLPKAQDGKDGGSADIDLSLGSLRLRVKALRYHSSDTPEAVRAFYAKELGRFGVIITCHGDKADGEPAHTPEGLTCGSEEHTGVHVDGSNGSVTLKAGSQQHQHLVDIESSGTGTQFALVALDLPRHLVAGDTNETK